jgi:hypothetical protein
VLVSEVIDQTLNEVLFGTYRAHYNKLEQTISSADGDLHFAYPINGIGEGSYVELEQELVYIVPGGLNVGAKTATVIRGVRGSVADTHVEGIGVSINPRFTRQSILNTMMEEARSWPNSLYQVESSPVTLSVDSTHVDLAGLFTAQDILRPVKVWRTKAGPDPDRRIRLQGWRFERDLSGPGSADLYIEQRLPSLSTLVVQVARPFSPLVSWTEQNALDEFGIPDSYAEILKYGASWRLVSGREARRLFTEAESEPRKAEEVPVQANATLGRQMKMIRDARIAEEINRLRYIYGLRG